MQISVASLHDANLRYADDDGEAVRSSLPPPLPCCSPLPSTPLRGSAPGAACGTDTAVACDCFLHRRASYVAARGGRFRRPMVASPSSHGIRVVLCRRRPSAAGADVSLAWDAAAGTAPD